ncbi:porin [Devosia sp. A16]|uniref:porin n=1 Tax=Devosia sp. A16 TaxID=1736675 RepID=UPI0009EA3341|nr:porin [Devosia sp. A16]
MRILIVAAAFAALLGTSPASAAVEYVRVCNAYGIGWFYLPGTDTCYNANTGETKRMTENGVVEGETKMLEQVRDANEGVALSLALPTAVVDDGKTFGAAVNFGTFNGENAIGIGGAFEAADGLTITGAVGLGLGRGTAGGRAGVNYSW